MKIAVVGIGYVGLGNGILLAKNNEVVMLDVIQEKVDMINNGESPIDDSLVKEYLKKESLNIRATTVKPSAYENAEYVIIAVPTDYNPETNYFNTSLIERVIEDVQEYNPRTTVIIKSTIPVGYVESISNDYEMDIFFSPEFLREGFALYDNLHPSRIVIGSSSDKAKTFVNLLLEGVEKTDNIPVVYTGSSEAEAIKLFANGYLAMRVAYFNELDNYCIINGLNPNDIISGVSSDPRIGNFYNNPSFGFGGYCLPKDLRQLLANFNKTDTPSELIESVIESNELRKSFIAGEILLNTAKTQTVGIHRLVMKAESDNYRSSAIYDVIARLKPHRNIVIYEPYITESEFEGIRIVKDLEEFKQLSDIIVTNRVDYDLSNVSDKVYTRDIYHSDI